MCEIFIVVILATRFLEFTKALQPKVNFRHYALAHSDASMTHECYITQIHQMYCVSGLNRKSIVTQSILSHLKLLIERHIQNALFTTLCMFSVKRKDSFHMIEKKINTEDSSVADYAVSELLHAVSVISDF